MKNNFVIQLSRCGLATALVVIFILSIIETGPELPGGFGDKFYHALAFFVLSCLSGLSYQRSGFTFVQPMGLLLYGIFIEVVQFFIPYRSFSVADMVADAAGIAVYHLLVKLFFSVCFFSGEEKI